MTRIFPPRHIVWSTDAVDLSDPFQRRWYIRQVLLHGRAEPRDAVGLFFIFQRESVERLLEWAAQKDPGFDLYWFAVALNRAAEFPDQADTWPVKTLLPIEPPEISAHSRNWP